MNRQIAVLLLLTATLAIGCRPAISEGTSFSLRLAYRTPHEGATKSVVESTKEVVFVMPSDLATGSDVKDVVIANDERGYPSLCFSITDQAAKTMSSTTKQHESELIAVVVDGNTLYALPIASNFSSQFCLTGEFTDDEIQEVYSLLTGYD